MVTLIGKLCVLCACSTLAQMLLPDDIFRGLMQSICGLLMLHMTFSGVREIAGLLAAQRSLEGIMNCLII